MEILLPIFFEYYALLLNSIWQNSFLQEQSKCFSWFYFHCDLNSRCKGTKSRCKPGIGFSHTTWESGALLSNNEGRIKSNNQARAGGFCRINYNSYESSTAKKSNLEVSGTAGVQRTLIKNSLKAAWFFGQMMKRNGLANLLVSGKESEKTACVHTRKIKWTRHSSSGAQKTYFSGITWSPTLWASYRPTSQKGTGKYLTRCWLLICMTCFSHGRIKCWARWWTRIMATRLQTGLSHRTTAFCPYFPDWLLSTRFSLVKRVSARSQPATIENAITAGGRRSNRLGRRRRPSCLSVPHKLTYRSTDRLILIWGDAAANKTKGLTTTTTTMTTTTMMQQHPPRRGIRTNVDTEKHTDGRILSVRSCPSRRRQRSDPSR